MPPIVVMVPAMVLILAQLFHLIFPGRISYPRRIILATAGVIVGELVGARLFQPGPRLGDLHPAWDLLLTAPLQLIGNRFLR